MKKYIIIISTVLALVACENQENEFPDFEAQTVYFPLQYPVRTLILGECRCDNTIDKARAFSVGVSIGGMYKNTKDRIVNIELDPSLLDNASIGGHNLEILPTNYYEPITFDQITIPSGSFNGKLRINLTNAFFADSLSTAVHYVLPLRILESTEDSVLSGKPLPEIGDTADARIDAEWEAGFLPKNYTLFAVKYYNVYHGTYLHRGVDNQYDPGNNSILDTTVYHTKYLEGNNLSLLDTRAENQVLLSRLGGTNQGGEFKMLLTFGNNGSVAIDSVFGGTGVWGSGSYVEANDANAEEWGGKKHRTIYLDYRYRVTTGNEYHHAVDTLVYRDNDVSYEDFTLDALQ